MFLNSSPRSLAHTLNPSPIPHQHPHNADADADTEKTPQLLGGAPIAWSKCLTALPSSVDKCFAFLWIE